MDELIPNKPEGHTGKQKLTLGILAALALVSVFVLPLLDSDFFVIDDGVVTQPVAETSPDSIAPSTVAEKTKYRQDSQSVLAQVVAIRDRLQEQNVEQWAEVEFNLAMKKIETGDEQYGYGEYRTSLDAYKEALADFELLEQTGQEKLANAITEGFAAIESLNHVVATRSSELAVLMAPQDPQVQQLAARTANLDALMTEMETGDQARERGDLGSARSAYELAVRIDPIHQRAQQALAEVRGEITNAGFRGHMSRGYGALERGDYNGARNAFRDAGKVNPGDPAVAQALAQVDNQQSQAAVSDRLKIAQDLESNEEWAESIALYEALLAEDPTLTEARVRLIPARVRASLDQQLQDFIAEPLELASKPTYMKASQTLQDARGIPSPGARLSGQIEELEELMVAAVSVVNVVFQSDNVTRVTLFRVAELGQFDQTSLQLRPGKYIAAGTRQGFRDVRVEFTITGKPLDEPIVVRCEESI